MQERISAYCGGHLFPVSVEVPIWRSPVAAARPFSLLPPLSLIHPLPLWKLRHSHQQTTDLFLHTDQHPANPPPFTVYIVTKKHHRPIKDEKSPSVCLMASPAMVVPSVNPSRASCDTRAQGCRPLL